MALPTSISSDTDSESSESGDINQKQWKSQYTESATSGIGYGFSVDEGTTSEKHYEEIHVGTAPGGKNYGLSVDEGTASGKGYGLSVDVTTQPGTSYQSESECINAMEKLLERQKK